MTYTKAVIIVAVALGGAALGASPSVAQDIAISLGDETTLSARAMQLIALMTVLSLAPGIAIMITCFPFVVTVLSILRQAIGLQAAPQTCLSSVWRCS